MSTPLAPDDLIRCDHQARAMAVKHCLRMQGARRTRTVVVREAIDFEGTQRPRVTEQQDAGPYYPFCALSCAQGRDIAARVRKEDAIAPPPVPARSPQSVIWTSAVPDVPIGPPPTEIPSRPRVNFHFTGPVSPETRREAEEPGPALLLEQVPIDEAPLEDAPAATSDAPPSPPTQTQEVVMACSNCNSKDHNVRTCPKLEGKRAVPSQAPQKSAEQEKARAPTRRRPTRAAEGSGWLSRARAPASRAQAGGYRVPVRTLTREEMVQAVEDVCAELARRQEDEAKRISEALKKAAA